MLSVRDNNRILFPLDPACHLVEPWTRAAELAVGLAAGRMRGCGVPEGGWHGLCSRQREHGDLCPPTAPRWAPRRACQRYLGLRSVRAERQTCLCYQRQPSFLIWELPSVLPDGSADELKAWARATARLSHSSLLGGNPARGWIHRPFLWGPPD